MVTASASRSASLVRGPVGSDPAALLEKRRAPRRWPWVHPVVAAVCAAVAFAAVLTAEGLRPISEAGSSGVSRVVVTRPTLAAVADAHGDQYVVWNEGRGLDSFSVFVRSRAIWTSPTRVPGVASGSSVPAIAVLDRKRGRVLLWLLWRDGRDDLRSVEAMVSGLSIGKVSVRWGRPHVVGGTGSLASSPAATVVPWGRSAGLWTVWRGAGAGLWTDRGLIHGDRVAWPPRAILVPGMGPLGSGPTVAGDGAGDLYVYWRGAAGNGNVWGAWFVNGVWSQHPTDLTFSLGTGSPPAVGVLDDGAQDIFWRGTDGNLWFAESADGAWLRNGANMTGDGPVDSEPAVTSSALGADVFWLGSGGNVWVIRQSSPMLPSWGGEVVIATGAARS